MNHAGFLGRFFGSWRLALGELLIVALGVLLALWADQAMQSRQDTTRAISYLQRLQLDLGADIEALSFSREQEKNRLAITRRVDAWVSGSSALAEPDLLLINAHYAGVTFSPTISRFTIEELKSTGDLRLIRNPRLKNGIARYYNQIALQIDRWVAWSHSSILETYFRELAFVLNAEQRLRLATFDPALLQRFLRADASSDTPSLEELQRSTPAISATPDDAQEMLRLMRERPNFLGYLRDSMYWAQLSSQILDGVIVSARELEAAIQEELERLGGAESHGSP